MFKTLRSTTAVSVIWLSVMFFALYTTLYVVRQYGMVARCFQRFIQPQNIFLFQTISLHSLFSAGHGQCCFRAAEGARGVHGLREARAHDGRALPGRALRFGSSNYKISETSRENKVYTNSGNYYKAAVFSSFCNIHFPVIWILRCATARTPSRTATRPAPSSRRTT